jgi:RHS repeat-associated protein
VANPGGPYSGTPGQTITFNGTKSTGPSGQSLSYEWSFGDGSTGTGKSPTHSYTAVGTYTVSLTVIDNLGGSSTASTTATIANIPTANPGGPYISTVGEAVVFNGSKSREPSGQSLKFAWQFGDGSSGTGENPTHIYKRAGTYSVSLTVSDNKGAGNSATTTATIETEPVADIGGPYNGTPGRAVAFNGSKSTGPPGEHLSFAWKYGDGSTGTGEVSTHSYAKAGNYTVSLTVTDKIDGSSTTTTKATIEDVPLANPGGPYAGTAGQAILFNGSGSTAPPGQSLNYAWEFGDGSSGTGVSPKHSYSAEGSFTVSLTVSDALGESNTEKTTAQIGSTTVANPGGPYTGTEGEEIRFDGANSTGPRGQKLEYEWSFGDGSTATGVSPSHKYKEARTYKVSLKVIAGNQNSTALTTATILAQPVANPGGPYNERPGRVIGFNGSKSTSPTGQALTYKWDFGDGSAGTGVSTDHKYSAAGSYKVSLTVTDGAGGTNTATTTATIANLPTANPGGPYSGSPGQAITFSGSKSTGPAKESLSYAWSFGDGSTATGAAPTHSYKTAGNYTVTLTVSDPLGGTGTASTMATIVSGSVPPTITGFAPTSGSIGTEITVSGTNFSAQGGPAPQVALSHQGGGMLNAPVSAFSATSLSFVIPPGAATGTLTVKVGAQSATSSGTLTVTPSSSFTLGVTPGTGSLIPGQSAALAVSLSSTNGFTGTAALSVTGLPSGVTASFQPTSIAVGQVGVLTLSAPASQAAGTSTLTIAATTTIQGQPATQSANASLQIIPITTSFLGRTVVDDAQQEPIAGVTIAFTGKDDKGNSTGCTGQTVSDGGGNFQFTSLPTACTGPQLIAYNGMTATSPAGKYAGVNLSYTLVSGQALASPVLIHLPRIDSAETVQVQQNFATDQIFYFQTIPGLKVTVYAGTTLSLDDGSQPNPFPLVGIEIPLDRLPDALPTSGMLTPFIVAFQPANAVSSQPVAVDFPNPLATPPGSHVTFVTLDPTHGYMVPYGTGTVTSDGTQFKSDPDPTHPGHAYGLVHFDWHGPMPPPPPNINPPPDVCPCTVAGPVDVSSGIVSYTSTDLQLGGARGSIGINRYYRTLASYQGPFGIGTSSTYNYSLSTLAYIDGGATITLAMPDGNQLVMSEAPDGTFVNATAPILHGAVLTANGIHGPYTLRWANGIQYGFTNFSGLGAAGAFLTSITDLNGNTTNISLNPNNPVQIQAITDPVGRSLTLTSDSSNRVTKVTDPIGRSVSYTYNSQGTLATFTDASGGVTSYTYDSANNLATITDPRGVVTEQNTYNESFDGRVFQQVEADGGVYQFAYSYMCSPTPELYAPANVAAQQSGGGPVAPPPGCVPTSPVVQTQVTDPLGNQTLYRFNAQGLMVSATDASGQTQTMTRSAANNNLISAYTGAGSCPVCGNPAAGNVSYTFDQFGNTLTQTDALGNTTTFTYDTRFNKVNSITDPLNHTTSITYDSNGNVTSITDANGNTTQMAYDSFGELIQVTDPTGSKTAIAYDSYGNVASVTDALGNTSTSTYDAVSRLTRAVDALGRNSSVAYDALNRVTSQTDPLGHTTAFTYDPIGDLLSLTDARGNSTKYTYDKVGRLVTRTSPLGKSESYAYDVDSNLTQYTDRRGQKSTFQYDALNRLVQENYSDATVTRSYDTNGRLVGVNDSQGGTFGFAYDADGHLLTQQEPTGVVSYTRDALGRVATRQVAGQSAVQYAYDPVGNMLSAATSAAGVTYKYDPRNLPQSLTRTNGVVTNFAFDALGQLLSIIHSNGATALNTQNYTYDAVGNRTAIGNNISQALITQSASATVDNANELLTNGGTTYTYDANGNRLTETSASGTLTYNWDGRNRLSSITDASGNTTSMQYDYSRNLLGVSRTETAVTALQSFVVDNLSNVVSLTGSSGTPVSVVTGQSLDSHFASVDSSGNVLFGMGDALNSNVAVTNSAGALTSELDYEPYGQTTGAPASDLPFAYTGRLGILGNVYYNRARYYDSGVGRFLSEDPLGIAGGPNPYRYASGDPNDFIDPSGYLDIGNIPDIIFGLGGGAASASLDCQTNNTTGVGIGLAVGGLAAIGAAVLTPAGASVLTAALIAGAAAGLGDYVTQGLTSGWGNVNPWEVVGASVAGLYGGSISKLVSGYLEGGTVAAKLWGSVAANLAAAPPGVAFPIVGKALGGGASESCGCKK